jgi:hypothetical protein
MLPLVKERYPQHQFYPLSNHASNSEGVNDVEFGRKKEKVLRVTMDRFYDMLVQLGCLPTKNESGLRKSDTFCRFHEAMGHNINECEEFHQKVIHMMTYNLLKIENKENDDVISMISFQ